jgi:hypothetical protein
MNRTEPLLPVDQEQIKRFDQASNHPYECRCELCAEWWELVGPEDEGDGSIDDEEPF